MKTLQFNPQSPNWARYEIVFGDGVDVSELRNVRLLVTRSGLATRIEVLPGGEWSGAKIDHDGKIVVSEASKGETLAAYACTGNWSGGGCYRGYVFGKPGAAFRLSCKGQKKWITFDGDGAHRHEISPFKKAVEV